MNKIFILALLCFGAYGCDPADPVPYLWTLTIKIATAR